MQRASLSSPPTLAPYALDAAWPCMRGDLRNTGSAFGRIVPDAPGVIRRWDIGNATFSTPVIDARERVYVGGADGLFIAFDAKENREVWRAQVQGVIDSAACIGADGTVYVPSGDALFAFDAADGTERWRFNLLRDRTRFSPSTIYWWEGNAVLGPDGNVYAGSDDFRLYSITPEGSVRWSVATGLHIWAAPAFNHDTLFVPSFDLYLYALSLQDGRERWRCFLQDYVVASPAMDEAGDLYVGGFDGFVTAIDGATGTVRWRMQTGGPIYASAALMPDGHLCVGSGDGTIYVLRRSDGTVRWTYDTHAVIRSSAVVGPDPEHLAPYLIYVGDGAGEFRAFDSDGQCRWTFSTAPRNGYTAFPGINASPALGNMGICVPTARGEMMHVPYGAYLQSEDPALRRGDAPVQVPASHVVHVPVAASSTLPKLHDLPSLRIDRMSVLEPAIVASFDQIAIASLWIDIGIIHHDPDTGEVVAWGVQRFGEDASGQPIGVPSTRRLYFAFLGTYRDGLLELVSERCHFEITAFAVPVDRIRLTARMTPQGWEGQDLAIEASYGGMRSDLRRRLNRLLWPRPDTLFRLPERLTRRLGKMLHFRTWFPGGLTLHDLRDAAVVGWRFTQMSLVLTRRRAWLKWGLLDEQANFSGTGAFRAMPLTPESPRMHLRKLTFHRRKRQVIARLRSSKRQPPTHPVAPGILLIDARTRRPILLPYSAHLHVSFHRHSTVPKRIILDVPPQVQLEGRHVNALLLLGTEVYGELPLRESQLPAWTLWEELRGMFIGKSRDIAPAQWKPLRPARMRKKAT